MPNETLALTLTGGGARAAYQAGVLRALSQLWPEKASPFKIVTGISAGSINASMIAHHADDFDAGTKRLWELWGRLSVDKVYKADSLTLLGLGSFVLRDLLLGGFFPRPVSSHLLDTRPLRTILDSNVDFSRIHGHVRSGALTGFAVTATNYHNGCAVTFFDAPEQVQSWSHNNHLSLREPLSSSHVMASASIPVFFPPIEIRGRYYGDGSVRLLSPLSPAIHLGADRVLAIGIRHGKGPEQYQALDSKAHLDISFADIAGVFLNGVFLDSLESDLQRMRKINDTIQRVGGSEDQVEGAMRVIPVSAIMPSRDLGTLATGNIQRFPFLLRHLLQGIGARRKRGQEVLSYLTFEASYCSKLLRLGYKDGMRRKDELLEFMMGSKA